jgi:hypothetical protein
MWVIVTATPPVSVTVSPYLQNPAVTSMRPGRDWANRTFSACARGATNTCSADGFLPDEACAAATSATAMSMAAIYRDVCTVTDD